jgi:hypothetical protein
VLHVDNTHWCPPDSLPIVLQQHVSAPAKAAMQTTMHHNPIHQQLLTALLILPALAAVLQDVQLVLFTTVNLAQGVLLPYQTSNSVEPDALEEPRHSNKLFRFCCIRCTS